MWKVRANLAAALQKVSGGLWEVMLQVHADMCRYVCTVLKQETVKVQVQARKKKLQMILTMGWRCRRRGVVDVGVNTCIFFQ